MTLGLSALVLVAGFATNTLLAHEIRPSIAELSVGFDGEIGEIRVSIALNLESVIARIGPGHEDTSQSKNAKKYDILRSYSPLQLRTTFRDHHERFLNGVTLNADGIRLGMAISTVNIPPVGDLDLARTSTVILSGKLPALARNLTWAWAREFGSSVIRIKGTRIENPNEQVVVFASFLRDGKESEPIPVKGLVPQTTIKVTSDYLETGFTHILPKGLDHILFVVGLFLLSTRLSSLVWQISSFTIAHTLTLGLAMAGVIELSPRIVEPLIAASIVYVGVENAFTSNLHRWRPVVVFAFGLLHGLGFAGVLTEIGLQPAHFLVGLVAFNVGVELGQLTIIASCFLAVGLWFREKSWYRTIITTPGSLLIALVGAWWFFERVYQ